MTDISDLSTAVTALITQYGLTRDEFADLMAGAADGGPSSNGYYPITKADGSGVVQVPSPLKVNALATRLAFGAINVSYATRALLNADLNWDAGKIGFVTADSTAANNDFYIKVGASGVGSWTLTTIIHDAITSAAAGSVTAAATSATNAASSATASATSATNAATSATNAAASTSAASGSATAAATSAAAASGSASAAATSATNAASSATSASGSATASAASATTAGTSATAASGSATAAATSATNAATSATAASGSATAAAASATTLSSLVSALPLIAPTGYEYAWLDQYGLACGGILTDGTFRFNAANIDTLTVGNLIVSNSLALANGDATLPLAAGGQVWSILDQYGREAIGLKADGTFVADTIEAITLSGKPVARIAQKTISYAGNFPAEICHLISYGQSLSLGQASSPVQTATQRYDGIMFSANGLAATSAGPRAQDGGGTQAQNHASFVTHVEVLNSGSANAETPLGNTNAMIKRLLVSENDVPFNEQSFQLLSSAPGQSNTTIAGLSKGQTPYTNLINDVTYGASLAAAAGKTYNVPEVFWTQGTADYQGGQSRAAHLALFNQLYADLNTDIKAITGQTNDIKLIFSQCTETSGTSGLPPTIGLAQYDASLANANIILACPTYHLENSSVGNVHLSGYGSATLGAHYGLTFKRVIIDGLTWKPLKPNRVWRPNGAASNIVLVRFDVPQLPLKLDTACYKTAVTNSGFSAIDGSNANNPVTSVTLVQPDTVKVVLTNAVAGKLRYGFINSGGNLRDSQGDFIDAGINRAQPLHNPCIVFEETFA